MKFAYLRDPLFLACVALYFCHRALVAFELSPWWLRYYLNDVICLGFWVPIMVWAQRRLELRRHDAPPTPIEVVIPLVIWAIVFEFALPRLPMWQGLAHADPNDVLAYAIGGLVAMFAWSWMYAPESNWRFGSRSGEPSRTSGS